MNAAAQAFLAAAARAKVITWPPRILYEGQHTFTKKCNRCRVRLPHIREEDYSECVLCGHRVYAVKSKAGR